MLCIGPKDLERQLEIEKLALNEMFDIFYHTFSQNWVNFVLSKVERGALLKQPLYFICLST